MAFTRPVAGADISAADFGQPVYDLVTHPPGRIWGPNLLSQTFSDSTWGQVNGSTILPTETGVRRWIVLAMLTVDPTQPSMPKDGYVEIRVNGATQEQYQLYLTRGNEAKPMFFQFGPMAITSFGIWISNMRIGGGRYTWIDGGP